MTQNEAKQMLNNWGKEGIDKLYHWFVEGGIEGEQASRKYIQNLLTAQTLIQETKEIVICSAVKTIDGRVFRGHRHSDCFQAIRSRGLKISTLPEDQGFITSKNRYVDRFEAFKIQQEAGILSVAPEEGYKGKQLYSEDLY